ncbi:bifunctional 2-polyprenyl-6-hydroxyphenol methylase/3-demethylubiquinol 3-O-methyltransferase UbiG [Kribbella sp. VKM Ac-2568]|uniref:class I SAM-dependent methyltransferase n=1 Tax=Kribbella sp. VKM Ac-2568 TaxID=2512219 RepID=UPI0010529966|nr:class I SAM-dependent methyltransferase [Kribbella sp. VKM Ac-2568]
MAEDPYRDERLVQLYDLDNAAGDDHVYYRALADEIEAKKILDFGCGTGLLTRTFARTGRVVIGVDPSPTMLGYARKQPGAEAVTWIDGDASAVDGTGDMDLVVSSGNTMMHLSPETYPSVLGSLSGALRPGGVISFESRNPAARAWEQWTRDATYSERDTPAGHLREWIDVTESDHGRVVFDAHNVFPDGSDAVYTTTLYFRTASEITADLEHAGFTDIAVHGGWHHEPPLGNSRLLVVRATKR